MKWNIINPEIKNDDFYFNIINLIENQDIKTILEIGASSGDGSTEALIIGKNKSKNKDNIKIFSIEVCTERFYVLNKRYENDPNFHPYNVSSININEFPKKDEIFDFWKHKIDFVPTVLGWYDNDVKYVTENNIQRDGIDFIKKQNNIDTFDLVLIDGSEFTGFVDLMKTYGAKYILLDDTNVFKNFKSREFLRNDQNYICIYENNHLRNGYAIFKKI